MPQLSKYFEFRILLILGIVTLTWHLFTTFATFFAGFADIFLLIILSWILSFILEPLVSFLVAKKLKRTISAGIIYLGITVLFTALISLVVPTIITQLTQLGTILPSYLPQNSSLTPRLESFLTSTLTNSIQFASQIATGITSFVLVFIISFYFLISKEEVSKAIKKIIPDEYEDDYAFFEKVINKTFASFIQVQFVLGIIFGIITYLTLLILGIDFAVTTSIASTILAMVPVLGGLLFIFPAMLAALTVSFDKLIIITVVLTLASQLVINIIAPKLLGNALKIHPLIVLVSFLFGFKIAGIWGAIFSVPVVSAFTVIAKELLKYWKEEADK